MTIEYIQKIATFRVEPNAIEMRLVQIGALPLGIPAYIRFEQKLGGFELTWRWLPNESEECVLIKKSGMVAPVLLTLARRLLATKPWIAGPPVSPGES